MRKRHRLILFIFLSAYISSNKISAQDFITDSKFTEGRTSEYPDTGLLKSKKAFGGNLFLGPGFFKGDVSNYFTNPYYIGLSLDLYRGRLLIQLDNFIGYLRTEKIMIFPDGSEWEENDAALSFLFGFNLGYSLIDTKNIRFSPIAGIGVNHLMSSSSIIVPDYTGNEPWLPYYKAGFFIDLKSVIGRKDRKRVNDKDIEYTSIRISSGINLPIGQPVYSEYYYGRLIYITIGLGGYMRAK